jgi:hypothetical protein
MLGCIGRIFGVLVCFGMICGVVQNVGARKRLDGFDVAFLIVSGVGLLGFLGGGRILEISLFKRKEEPKDTPKKNRQKKDGGDAEEWYCQIDKAMRGPFSAREIRRMARLGKLKPTDLLKKTKAGEWMPASSVEWLIFRTAGEIPDLAAKAECPSCQTVLNSNAALCVNCGLDLRTGKKPSPPKPGEKKPE